MQPLKLATSNLVHSLDLGVTYRETTFLLPKLAPSGLLEHPKIWTLYLFLQPLKIATSKTTWVWGVGWNNNFSTKLGRDWLGYGRTPKIVGTMYPVPCNRYSNHSNVNINVKTAFIHKLTANDTSKTAKITKRL